MVRMVLKVEDSVILGEQNRIIYIFCEEFFFNGETPGVSTHLSRRGFFVWRTWLRFPSLPP